MSESKMPSAEDLAVKIVSQYLGIYTSKWCLEQIQDYTRAVLEAAAEVCEGMGEKCWPKDVFLEPPPGEHGQTVDACSARALRGGCAAFAAEIRRLGESL